MEISVLGRRIPVRFLSTEAIRGMAGDDQVIGLFQDSVIYISSSLKGEKIGQVLFHELAHAILQITGQTNLYTEEQEEALCDALENFIEVFKNKELVQFLTSDGSEDASL